MDSNQTPQPSPQPKLGGATVAQVQAAQFVNDMLSGKVKVEAPRPRPKGAAGTTGFLLGGMISKDSVLLGTIVILLLVIIGMTIFVIGAATRQPVNVIFQQDDSNSNSGGNSTVDTNTGSTGGSSGQDLPRQDNAGDNISAETKDLTIMMLALISSNKDRSYPSGTIDIPLGEIVDFKLVPVQVKVDVESGQELKTALEILFGQREVMYKGLVLSTSLDLSDISVNVISDPTGQQIQLTGDLVAAGDLSPLYMKSQIEKTIEKYSSKYVITLNGSASDYKCFGDLSGNCQ